MEMWITAIATGVIAIYAFMSYRLASKIKTKDDENRQQVTDLFRAIVISNIASSSSRLQKAYDMFNSEYDGHTKIFHSKRGD